MNYSDLIKDAFWVTLRNRYLWFFGFFAGVGTNFGFPSPSWDFDGEDRRQASAAPVLACRPANDVRQSWSGRLFGRAGVTNLARLRHSLPYLPRGAV